APAEVRFFEGLASVMDRVKAKLEEEQARLIRALPLLPSEYSATDAGAAYRALAPGPTAEALTRWTEEDVETLGHLEERLDGTDPSEEAKRLRRIGTQIRQLSAR